MSEQLQQWLNGTPVHGEECCPDFSCCTGNIAPLEVRQRYVKAVQDGDERTKFEMLGMFLGEAMAREGKKVYVAGTDNKNIDSGSPMEHIESKDCWCSPVLIQAIDDEHDCEVWSHRGHEELNQ